MLQQDALKILKAGRNVYLTGAAGAGKTYVINQYIEYLKSHRVNASVTASTGIAATHIGGMTIHSWSGVGIKNDLTDWDIDGMEQKQYLVKRLTNASVLIIDEVSMLSPNMLDMVDQVCKALRRSTEPFGGLQIVLSGDFFQLPPIMRGVRSGEEEFADSSRAWRGADIRTCYITEQYRQQSDPITDILNDVRDGTITSKSMKLLESRVGAEFKSTDGEAEIEPIRLYTHNMNVDARNQEELAKLTTKSEIFEMTGKGNKRIVETLKRGVLAPETLELKKGAKVMFVKNNFEAGYVNGTLGEVTGFEFGRPVVMTSEGDEIVVNAEEWMVEDGGKSLASVSQLPLRLAWAITVHKSQGMSLDAAEIDLSKAFAPGQGYVALSRLRTLEGLVLLEKVGQSALQMHPYIVEFDKWLHKDSYKWERVIARFDDEALQKMYDAHILDCGGIIDKVEIARHKVYTKDKEEKTPTKEKTRRLIVGADSLEDIATQRGLKLVTIIGHIEQLKQDGVEMDIERFNTIPDGDFEVIADMFEQVGSQSLVPAFKKLKGKYSYDDLKLARLFVDVTA
jgi:DNA-dependent RNA polymerase auxiliary subunit epsilon